GGDIPIHVRSSNGETSIKYVPIGTHVEVVPVLLPNQRIRMQTVLELNEVRKKETADDDGSASPDIASRRLNTEIEMKLGQSLTSGRWLAQRSTGADEIKSGVGKKPLVGTPDAASSQDTIETIVFITPRLAQSGAPLRPAPLLPIGADDPTLQPIVPAA